MAQGKEIGSIGLGQDPSNIAADGLTRAQSANSSIVGVVASTASGDSALPDGRSLINFKRGRKGSILFDFSDTANWSFQFAGNTGKSADTTNKVYSSQGLKMGGLTATVFDGPKKSFGSNTFAIQSGALIKLLVYVPPEAFTASTAINTTIRFSSDNNATKSLSFTFPSEYFRHPGWTVLAVRADEDGSQTYQNGATWTAAGGEVWGNNFNYFHITINAGNFASGQYVTFDSMVIGEMAPPQVVWTFDSVTPSLLNVIAPSLKAYGWTATIFIDGDTTSVENDSANLKNLINNYGWSIGTQGITHTSYTVNGRDVGADYDTCKANYIAAGLPAPVLWAYPQNASNSVLDATLAGRGVKWVRRSGYDILNVLPGLIPNAQDGMIRSGFTQHLGTNWNLGTNYSQVKNRVDSLLNTGGILSLFTHKETALSTDWSLGGDVTQWYMLLDYLYQKQQQNGLRVINAADIAAEAAKTNWQ